MNRRTKTATLAAALTLGALSTAAAGGRDDGPRADAPTYLLKRRDAVGDVYRVETLERSVYDVMIRAPGKAVLGGEEVKEERQVYTEEVIEVRDDGTVVLKRDYELATRVKKHPTAKKADAKETTLHGREVQVTIRPNGTRAWALIGGGTVPDDDKNDGPEQIAYGALTGDPVAVGSKWDMDPQRLGKALFGPIYDEKLFRIRGQARLRRMKRHQQVECARVQLASALRVKKTEAIPGILLDVSGEVLFSPALGRVLAFELEGPIGWEVDWRGADGTEDPSNIGAKGTTRLSYRATPQ